MNEEVKNSLVIVLIWLLNPKNKKIARNLFTEQQAKRSILPEVWQAIDHHD